jgi:uncharacterized protein with FMN-binding domain
MEETIPQANSRNNSSKLLIPFIVVVIALGIIAFAVRAQRNSPKSDDAPAPEAMRPDTTEELPSSQNESQNSTEQSYKDGTYTTTGNYVSPGGAEELEVLITLKDGIITDAEVESKATRPNSVKFQGLFVSGYKPLVVGKSIDDVQLTKVSGSSLSPQGFNEALSEIKEQARS